MNHKFAIVADSIVYGPFDTAEKAIEFSGSGVGTLTSVSLNVIFDPKEFE